MRQPWVRPGRGRSLALAAALSFGALGGGLVGLGALGVDGSPAGASTCAGPAPQQADDVAVDGERNVTVPGSLPLPGEAHAPAQEATCVVRDAEPAVADPVAPGRNADPEPALPADRPQSTTATPTPSATPSAAPSATPSAAPSATSSPVLSAAPSPVPSATASPTVSRPPTPAPAARIRPVQGSPVPGPVRPVPPSTAASPDRPSAVSVAQQPPAAPPVPAALPAGVAGRTDSTIGRAAVIARAASWLVQRVPYSQASWWSDANGTYRQDCSGYVSMAWRLDPRANYWTGNLDTVSTRIPTEALKPGDVLNLPFKHVVIFGGWADATRTRFNLYEQYATGSTPRYAVNASLAYYLDRGYGAFRYNGIIEGGPAAVLPLNPTGGTSSDTDDAGEESGAGGTDSTEQALGPDFAVVLPPAGVSSVPWTPEAAAAVVEETSPPSAAPDAVTPVAVPDLPASTLVQAQRELDRSGNLTIGRAAASSDGYLVAAGLGLMFLAVPLGVGARMGAWSPRAGFARGVRDDAPIDEPGS